MVAPGRSGVFLPASNFENRCVNPRANTVTSPGSITDENNWLRSWTNDTYLWFSEVVDRDPGTFSSTLDYFALLKTTATTPSGQAKDKFHFTYDTDDWIALSESGISAGYGAAFEILSPTPPRRIVVAYVEQGDPAFGELQRGDEIHPGRRRGCRQRQHPGRGRYASTPGLFPGNSTRLTPSWSARRRQRAHRAADLRGNLRRSGARSWTTFDTPSGDVGYILFNDHSAVAEDELAGAIHCLDDTRMSPI